MNPAFALSGIAVQHLEEIRAIRFQAHQLLRHVEFLHVEDELVLEPVLIHAVAGKVGLEVIAKAGPGAFCTLLEQRLQLGAQRFDGLDPLPEIRFEHRALLECGMP